MKILHILVFLLLTSSVYGQKSTLIQNVNVRAKELKHSLNKTGDSLILEGERTIYKVVIFNKDYEQSLTVKDSKIIIPLNNIPVGRFVIEAAMPDRLIVITLLRNEAIRSAINKPQQRRKTSLFGDAPLKTVITKSTPKKEVIEPKVAVINKVSGIDKKTNIVDNKVAVIDKQLSTTNKTVTMPDKKSSIIDDISRVNKTELTAIDKNKTVYNEKLTKVKNTLQNSGHRIVESYWIVYKTNNGHSSGKIMQFGNHQFVEKMISKINLDKRTKAGKSNELIIYEIYNVDQFVKFKSKKLNDLNSKEDFFNSNPYFITEKGAMNP